MTCVIVTVSELTSSIKQSLEGTFPFVWVRGQVSNCSRPSSGHLYFSLKDEGAILNAVWFKGQQKDTEAFDPLTGEVFEDGPRPSLAGSLQNGQEIVCAGRLTVYPPRGAYQLVVELAQDAGQGRLQIEFERIKAALSAKGYFAQERKRPLPAHPTCIAVITATSGAAVHDFLRMAKERGTGGEIRIYPALVQGKEAPVQIASGLRRAADDGWAEVIVLIRGGGSLEDLWAFNSLEVAEGIFTSPVPVVAGIGHEVDVSIADLVADVRAATPTHAAQILWTEKREFIQRLDEMEIRLANTWRNRVTHIFERLAVLTKSLEWLSPAKTLTRRTKQLAEVEARLRRGITAYLRHTETLLASLEHRFPATFVAKLARTEHAAERLAIRLKAADPLGPLERGYALARNAHGTYIRSTSDASPGERLDLLLHDGMLPVRVEHSEGNE